MGTAEVISVGLGGSISVWSEYVDLISKEEEGGGGLFRAPKVGTGARAVWNISTTVSWT